MRGTLLWRYRVVITAGVLMIISLHLLTTGVQPGDIASKPVSELLWALSPVQGTTTNFVEGGSGILRDYFELVGVARENQQLKAQLAHFRSDRSKLAELEIENHHLSDLLELSDALELKSVAANVIGSDANGIARTLILGAGSENGLKEGMAVLSIQGVVGKIIMTSAHASRVLLIDDHNSALDAFDQRSRARGIIAGVVDDGLIMKYVGRTQDLREGDTVVTAGLDDCFPRGLLVGKVKSIGRDGPGMFLTVAIAPAVDFSNLEQVLVVTQTPPHLGPQSDTPG